MIDINALISGYMAFYPVYEILSPYRLSALLAPVAIAIVGFSVCKVQRNQDIAVNKTAIVIVLLVLAVILFIREYSNLYYPIWESYMLNDFGVFLKLLNPFAVCKSIIYYSINNGQSFAYATLQFCDYFLPYSVTAIAIVIGFVKKNPVAKLTVLGITTGLLCVAAIMNFTEFVTSFVPQIGDIIGYYGAGYVIYFCVAIIPIIGRLCFFVALFLLFWARPDCLKKSAKPRAIPKAELDLLRTKLEIGAITEEQYRQQLEQLKYPS